MCEEEEEENQAQASIWPNNMQRYRYVAWNHVIRRKIFTDVTKSHEFVNSWIEKVQQQKNLIVGLGIELASANAVGTITLCFDRNCLIYHMFEEASFPPSLKQFIQHSDHTFVGFDQESKLKILKRQAGFNDVRYHDLRFLASQPTDLGPLVMHVLRNLDLVRLQPDRPWDTRKRISYLQAAYTSIGAYMSLQMGRLLLYAARQNPRRVMFRERIVDGGEMDSDYLVYLFDKTIVTTVTKKLRDVEDWIDGNMNELNPDSRYVGFDVGLVSVHNQPHPRIGTVQLCVKGTRCLIIQLHQMEDVPYLPTLEDFLLKDYNVFVGFDAQRKMNLLTNVLVFAHGGRVKGIDLEIMDMNKKKITRLRRYIGRVHARVGSDWDRPLLSEAQIRCACRDAATSYEIVRRLRDSPT